MNCGYTPLAPPRIGAPGNPRPPRGHCYSPRCATALPTTGTRQPTSPQQRALAPRWWRGARRPPRPRASARRSQVGGREAQGLRLAREEDRVPPDVRAALLHAATSAVELGPGPACAQPACAQPAGERVCGQRRVRGADPHGRGQRQRLRRHLGHRRQGGSARQRRRVSRRRDHRGRLCHNHRDHCKRTGVRKGTCGTAEPAHVRCWTSTNPSAPAGTWSTSSPS